MDHRSTGRASDEVPFLSDEEKDVFMTARQSSKRAKKANLLPYSAALNIIMLLVLLTTWILHKYDAKEAYIPNEIYCKSCENILYASLLIDFKRLHKLLLNMKLWYSLVA